MKTFVILWLFSISLFAQWSAVEGISSTNWNQGIALKNMGSSGLLLGANTDNPGPTLFFSPDNGAGWDVLNYAYPFTDCDAASSEQFTIVINSQILGSTDGGFTWDVRYDASSTSSYLNVITMFDESRGFAIGDALNESTPAPVLVTSDGGLTWINVNTASLYGAWSIPGSRVCFPSPQIGYFYDSFSKKLHKTADGGASWNIVANYPFTDGHIIKFFSDNDGIVLGYNDASGHSDYGKIAITSDGGSSWNVVQTSIRGFGKDILFVPDSPAHIWLATQEHLYFSLNGGLNWTEDDLTRYSSVPQLVNFACTESAEGKTVWLLADQGVLYKNVNSVMTNSDHTPELPSEFTLLQNFPNPFNPSTSIQFHVAAESYVTVSVYSILGTEVAVLVQEPKQPGIYSVSFQPEQYGLASGTYIVRMTAGNYSDSKKMLYLK